MNKREKKKPIQEITNKIPTNKTPNEMLEEINMLVEIQNLIKNFNKINNNTKDFFSVDIVKELTEDIKKLNTKIKNIV